MSSGEVGRGEVARGAAARREASRADVGLGDVGLLEPGSVGSAVEAATGDGAFLRAMLDAEAALARAQALVGLVPERAAAAITTAAAGPFDARSLAERARSGGNPVIPLVEDLRAAAPEAAEFVHRGATSQDVMDTAAMLIASAALDLITTDLDRTAEALRHLATEHRDTPMPARTLTQHAVPTTFGLKAAGWRSLVLGARDRIVAVRLTLPVQLGGAAGTLGAFSPSAGPGVASDAGIAADLGGDLAPGADIPLRLVSAFAAELGLAEPGLPWHVLRAPIADLAGALAFTSGALGKVAVDVLTLSRTEIGELSEGVGGGSSSMPHKVNPVRATLIASAARQVPALASVLFASMAAEDERPAGAWHAEWQPLRQALRVVGGAARDAAELAVGLRVHSGRMAANLAVTGHLSEPVPASVGALVDRALRLRSEDGS